MNNSDWLHWEANAEDGAMHREPSEEVQFFRAVAAGDLDAVRSSCERRRFGDHSGMGVLSRDPLTDIKYHFVIAAAMIARFCAQQGMEVEQALRLSDYYIGKLDDIADRVAVLALHTEMAMDYAAKMRRLSREASGSRIVAACREHVYAHIRERLTVADIAAALGVSEGYLSRLFKQEKGVSVSGYIREKKVDLARNMLTFGEDSIAEIAAQLGFSSQSHFIRQFREHTGLTPRAYRALHHGAKWIGDSPWSEDEPWTGDEQGDG